MPLKDPGMAFYMFEYEDVMNRTCMYITEYYDMKNSVKRNFSNDLLFLCFRHSCMLPLS